MTERALANDPAWLKRAFADLGLHEIAGPKHSARVLAMFKAAGHPEIHDDETAWCSAAVNTWMAEAGITGTRQLNARSWLDWGKTLPLKKIPRGAVLIFKRGNSEWQGHVTLCLSDDGSIVTCIGGNQADSVSIARYRKTALIGARWPGAVVSKPVGIADLPDEDQVDNLDPVDVDAEPVSTPTASEPAPGVITAARATAGTGVATIAGGQLVSSMVDGAGDAADKIIATVDKSGQVLEVTKKAVSVPKPGFWYGLLHVITTPEFIAGAVLVVGALWFLVWFLQRQHKQAQ